MTDEPTAAEKVYMRLEGNPWSPPEPEPEPEPEVKVIYRDRPTRRGSDGFIEVVIFGGVLL